MIAGKLFRGHSEIAVPDVIEFDRPDLRPQLLQALRHNNLESPGLVAGADHRSAGDKTIARVVAGKVKFAVGIGHRLPAGNDGPPRTFGRRLRRAGVSRPLDCGECIDLVSLVWLIDAGE